MGMGEPFRLVAGDSLILRRLGRFSRCGEEDDEPLTRIGGSEGRKFPAGLYIPNPLTGFEINVYTAIGIELKCPLAVSSGSFFPSASSARISCIALVALALFLSGKVTDRGCEGKRESPSKSRRIRETKE
jgi:hypothetical protein